METNDLNSWIETISDRSTVKRFQSGDVISLQGEALESLGYILSGRAKAIAFSEAGDATWVGVFKEDEFFGHTSLLTQKETHFEIRAEDDVEVLFVAAGVMTQLMSERESLSLRLTQDLAERLDHMTIRLIEAYTLSARGRICAELSRLSRVIGILPENLIIRPSPVFVELAERVNSTRETVSRTVSDLQKRGILTRESGAIVIKKPAALKAAIL